MASSSGSMTVCFNSTCKQAVEIPKPGWRCRTGDFADLCDRCFAVLKNGKFCDTFHVNASGWRCCESCGKQIHCGCIVSFHMFVLLDAGGIECLNCAKTEYILTPNPTWPSSSNFQGSSERIRDISSRNWQSISGSGPVPWRQAPSMFNAVKSQPELQLTSYSLGKIIAENPSPRLLNDSLRVGASEMTSYSLGKSIAENPSPRLVNDCLRVGASEMIGDRARPTGVQYDGQYKHNSLRDLSYQSFFHINATPISSLPATFVAHNKNSEKGNVSGIHAQQACPSPSVGKRCSIDNGMGPSIEPQTHNAKAHGETRGRPQRLPRYFPRITDQELQVISGSSNAKITPLFEKVLTVSDAGKIGRLVLPKKCAEIYLPPITQPEGIPLVVQDMKGKDWSLQYRFWLNNNSRMYVLEGVTSCIQSMQLQPGDTVTFSRLEPDGKLVMGFRKASLASPSDKGNETSNTRFHTHEEPSNAGSAFKSRNPDYAKRKGAQMCSNSKQFKPNKEEILQLNVTLEQVQGLLRPPRSNASTIVLIEGVEFEDFQEAPIVGSPTNFSTNDVGSLRSVDEPTPKRLEIRLPPINHGPNQENQESVKHIEGLDALADLAIQGGKATARHPRHKPGCSCIVCVQPPSGTKRSVQTPSIHHEVGNSVQNPKQLFYAKILGYTQMGNNNQNTKTGASQSFENDPNGENPSTSSFKSQNIDLNIQPDREDESSPVSDSIGIMRLVQESTQRYMRQQKLSINGATNENHKNHGL